MTVEVQYREKDLVRTWKTHDTDEAEIVDDKLIVRGNAEIRTFNWNSVIYLEERGSGVEQ